MCPFDEAYAAPGEPRAHYAPLLDALREQDLTLLRAALRFALREQGATFGDHEFDMCPVPRLLTAEEAQRLRAGLEQRARALNAFIADAYGERRISAAGRLPEWIIETADGYEPALAGRWPAGATAAGVAGLDVVRAADGELRVLEDNLRSPSGFTYAVAAARALRSAFPFDGGPFDDGADTLLDCLARALRTALPGREDPVVAVVSDGPQSAAYYEHRVVAEHLGVPLLSVDELHTDGDRLLFRDERGRRRAIDVAYRRSEEDRLVGDDGQPTRVGGLMLGPWLAGELAVVNGFGAGVGDDKLVHAYVEEMIGFYLGEEPIVRSVPTLDLAREEQLARLLDEPCEYVVKPRRGQGGTGVVVCAHASREDLRSCLDAVREHPREFVAQPLVTLSTMPTIIGDSLAPRHVDLRPFVFAGPGWERAVPSGLTRVAWQEGALVVNSSQDGGGKVTWALR